MLVLLMLDVSSADPGGRVPVAGHRELLRVRLPGVAQEAQLQVHLQQLHPGRAVRARVLGQLPHPPGPHPRQVASAPPRAVLLSSKINVNDQNSSGLFAFGESFQRLNSCFRGIVLATKAEVAHVHYIVCLKSCVQDEPPGGPVPGADQLLQLGHGQDPQLGGHQRAGRLPLHMHLLRVLRHALLRRRVLRPSTGHSSRG